MEYIVEKIGMSRTVNNPSIPVTLLKVVNAKVCEVSECGSAIVAYAKGKAKNKAIEGQQKKYSLTAEFNKFATLQVANKEAGDLDFSPLSLAKILKVSFSSKGKGYQGVVKRHGSIGNREWPGRVQPGMKMAGHTGNEKVTVKNEIVSFDAENGILVLKGSVAGYNGAMGRIRIVK